MSVPKSLSAPDALIVRAVTKSFGSTAALRGVDLTAPAGSVTAVLGPSGCGKTTLLRLIAGFGRPDAGTIELGGSLVSGPGTLVPTERRGLGYLAQEGALFPHLTVARNITFGLPRARRRDAAPVRELLDLVSLDGSLAGRYPHQLSGGQQQRVALARTLAPRPRLVLLDEPFSALDTGLRAETRAAVASALSTAGVTTVLVTHDQAEALSFADRVAVMHDGTMAQVGTPGEIYEWPADLRTARFIGDVCLVPVEVDGSCGVGPLGRVPVRRRSADRRPRAGPGWLMLRPEQLLVRPDGPATGADGVDRSGADGVDRSGADGVDRSGADGVHRPGADGVPAVTRTVEYFGHDCVVTAQLLAPPREPVTVTCRTTGSAIPPGTRVRIAVSGAGLFFPDEGAAGSGLDGGADPEHRAVKAGA